MRYSHTSYICAQFIASDKEYSSSTINSILSTLRGVLKQVWLLEQIIAENYPRSIVIENLKDKKEWVGHKIAFAEIQTVVDVCFQDETDSVTQNSAIIGLITTFRLRRSEFVQFALTDVDAEAGKVTVRSITTKLNVECTVWLRDGALVAMEDSLFVHNS